jgi:hypothetical protein
MHANVFRSNQATTDSTPEKETQPSTSEATSPSETNHNQPAVASEAETAGAAEKGSAGKQISERKLAANRRNAQRSTGPKTVEGKNNSRKNALQHGILARKILLLPDGQLCDPELSEFDDRLRVEYPGEDMYSEFLRDDALWAFSGYSRAIDFGKYLDSKDRWRRITYGDRLDRYLSTNRKALLHNLKELQKLEAERREQEAELSEENEQEVEITGSSQNGADDGFDFDPKEDHVDQDDEYEKAMLECEEYLYTPRSYYLDTAVVITKGDWFALDETSPTDEVERNVASNCSESPIDDGKPSPGSAAEPVSLAGTTHDLHERTHSNAIGVVDTLALSDVADALPPAEAQDELSETAGTEAKSETASLPSDGLIDQADLASIVASYAGILEDGETQTSIADRSESVMVNTVPNSHADPEDQISETDSPAVATGPEMEEPTLPLPGEVYDDLQVLPEGCGSKASPSSDLLAASMTVQ